MKVSETTIGGVLLITPKLFQDSRGIFFESWNAETYSQLGLSHTFVQDNCSHSSPGVLRGLHYQLPHAQAKLVRVCSGAIFDVAVDLRRNSPTCGKWFGVVLDSVNREQLFIPAGCAHGFCVLDEAADVAYKCTDFYHPECERTIRWDDPEIGIKWPLSDPILSAKDASGLRFRDAIVFDD